MRAVLLFGTHFLLNFSSRKSQFISFVPIRINNLRFVHSVLLNIFIELSFMSRSVFAFRSCSKSFQRGRSHRSILFNFVLNVFTLSFRIFFLVFGLLVILEVAEHIRNQSGSKASKDGFKIFFHSIRMSLFSIDSTFRIVSVLLILAIFLYLRLQLNGPHRLYKWTILENHVSLIEDFQTRLLSYAQMHFWYFFKMVYPRYLCFDYGYACIPLIYSLADWRNLFPLVTYSILIVLIIRGVQQARVALLVGLAVLLIPLLPALNIFFPVGTLLAERLMFIPSIGFCIIVADILVTDGRGLWEYLSRTFLDPVIKATISLKKRDFSVGTKSVYVFLSPMILWWATIVVVRNGDWASEMNLYSSALKVCPQSLKALTNYALLAIQANKLQEAADAAEGAIRIFPNQTAALVNAGIAYQRMDKFASSVMMFQRCLGVDPSNSKANGYLGGVLYDWASSLEVNAQNDRLSRHLRAEAISYSERAVALGFDAPNNLHLIGSMAMELGQYEKSVHYLKTAVEKSLELRTFRRGSTHVAVEDDINFPYTYNQLGLVYQTLGQVDKAIEAFQKGLEVDPGTIQIITNLGSLYREINQLEKAKEV